MRGLKCLLEFFESFELYIILYENRTRNGLAEWNYGGIQNLFKWFLESEMVLCSPLRHG